MNVTLFHVDGKLPNIALMRIAAHHKNLGDQVTLRNGRTEMEIIPDMFYGPSDLVYASLIFEKSRSLGEYLIRMYPGAIVGGTGWDVSSRLEDHGIHGLDQDYSIYPDYENSIGFTQRGCRLKCSFCVVPKKEGKVQSVYGIDRIWRGDPWPRNLVLLDNDFFGQEGWRVHIKDIREGGFSVSFCQGINARFLNKDSAAAIASVNYRSNNFKSKRIYTAWDNRKDEARLFRGLQYLVDAGIRPRHIMVYMLIGYWPGENDSDWEYRRSQLRDFGCDPYPMPFVRNRKTVGFQRFVCGAYDKRISWEDWKRADYRPRRLGARSESEGGCGAPGCFQGKISKNQGHAGAMLFDCPKCKGLGTQSENEEG